MNVQDDRARRLHPIEAELDFEIGPETYRPNGTRPFGRWESGADGGLRRFQSTQLKKIFGADFPDWSETAANLDEHNIPAHAMAFQRTPALTDPCLRLYSSCLRHHLRSLAPREAGNELEIESLRETAACLRQKQKLT